VALNDKTKIREEVAELVQKVLENQNTNDDNQNTNEDTNEEVPEPPSLIDMVRRRKYYGINLKI